MLLNNILAIHRNHPDCLHLLGICYLKSDKIKLSVTFLEKATILQPNNATFQYHYGLSLIESDQRDDAVRAFRFALDIDEDYIDARYNLAKALKDQGCYHDAAAAYEKLLCKKADQVNSLYNLANLYSEQNKDEKASELYAKVLTIDPQHINARINIALIYSRNGQRQGAIAALERVLEMDPTHDVARKHLRKLYSRLVPPWHFDMLNDNVRNSAYDRTIRQVAANARHVLEIGTGSGLLSMMAARAGARRVTTCEMVKPLADCARKIIKRNGFEDHIQVITKKSTSLEVGKDFSEKADVLIAEVFDVGLLGEHFLPALIHAKQNLLTENAVIVPAAATIKGILVECPDMRPINPVKTIAGFDLSDFNMFRAPGYRQFDMRTNDYCIDRNEMIQVHVERGQADLSFRATPQGTR